MQRFILILAILLFSCGSSYSQENKPVVVQDSVKYDTATNLKPVYFDGKEIEELRSKKEFEYVNAEKKESWWTRFKRWLSLKYEQLFEWLFGDYQANSVLLFIFSILPYLILALVLGLIIWLFLKLNPGKAFLEQPESPQVFATEEEELIQSADLQKLIEEAVQNGQFRLAVRYYFLKSLKELDRAGLISYQYQKTDEDYSSEILQENLRNQFRKISRLYEYVWYGDFKVSEGDFRLAEKGFIQMNFLLNRRKDE